MSKYEYTVIQMMENAIRTVKAQPLYLGGFNGSGGGGGGPPGGFVGKLPQRRVTYDISEAETDFTPVSGSLVDNLNHIRYRIRNLEISGVGTSVDVYDDGVLVASGITILDFYDNLDVTDLGGGHIRVDSTASGVAPSGAITFLDLTDTPDSYTGNANKVVSVKATEDGLEFVVASSGDMSKSVYDQNDNGIVDEAESVSWSGVTGKPATFPPDSHNHDHATLTNINSASYYHLTQAEYTDLTDGGETTLHTHSGIVLFNDAEGDPSYVGTLNDGVSAYAARRDHEHEVSGSYLLSKLITVDGENSGLDADLLDGHDSGYFAVSGHAHSVSSFLDLSDTPDDYTSQGAKLVAVKATEDGLEFVSVSGGGDMLKGVYDLNDNGIVDEAEAVAWSGITGKPATFPPDTHNHDHATLTNLNSATYSHLTQAEYTDLTDGGDTTLHTHSGMVTSGTISFLDLIDSPDSYATYSGYLVSVKSTEDGLEFIPTISGTSPIGAAGGDLAGTYPNPEAKGATKSFYLNGRVTYTLSGGTYNNLEIPGIEDAAYVYIDGATSTITGIKAPSPSRNKLLILYNASGNWFFLVDESTSSDPANRLFFPSASPLKVYGGDCFVFLYDTTIQRWVAIADAHTMVYEYNIEFEDNTNGDASVNKHGFLRKLSGLDTDLLDGTGAFTTLETLIRDPDVVTARRPDWGTIIHGMGNKGTLVDNDEFPIANSADGYNPWHVTWSNLKATLVNYFDTLYVAIASLFSDAEGDPANVGTTADGVSTKAARRDHVHAATEASLTLSDVTTNDASTSKHGLMQKLSGSASQYMGGDGVWHELPTTLSMFLSDVNSNIAGYETLTLTRPTSAETNVAIAIPADDTVLEEFVADANTFDFISSQVLHCHVHLAKTAGTKTATAYAKLFHRTSGGTETLMGTSAETINLTGSSAEYDLYIAIADTAFSSTDRFVLKVFGNQGGAGTDPTITMYFMGTTNARVEVGAEATNANVFSDAEGDPANVGTTADGTSVYAARRDHVHAQGGTASGDLTGTYPSPTVNINGKTEKTTPVDADETFLADSAASFATKKLTWANIKATLKTYLDTLYLPLRETTEWINVQETWTRTGDFTFTTTGLGDVTAKYRKGTKVRYKDGGSFEYGIVLSSSYSNPTMTITLFTNSDYAMAAATITEPGISYSENPEGFPDWFSWTPSYSASGSMTYTSVSTTYAKFKVSGSMVYYEIFATGTTGGTANNTLQASPPTTCGQASGAAACQTRDATSGTAVVGTGGQNSSLGIFVRKADVSNYGLGTGRILLSYGFYDY